MSGRASQCAMLALALGLSAWRPLLAQVVPDSEPKLLSVFPSVAQRGGTVHVELRGNHLEGTSLVWTAAGAGLSGKVTGVQQAAGEKQSPAMDAVSRRPPVFLVSVDLQLAADARVGTHWLRVASARGVSTAVRFDVVDSPVLRKPDSAAPGSPRLQPVNLPCLVNGRLSKPGETDIFEFRAEEGQQLTFRVTAAENFEPRLALLSMKTSWFDSARSVRIPFDEERSFDLLPIGAQGTFRAAQPGPYLLEVSSLFGKGCADCTYQLSMATGGPTGAVAAPGASQIPGAWRERSFTRVLGTGWMDAVGERSPTARPPDSRTLSSYSDREPDDAGGAAQQLTIPALIAGSIGRPGDVDTFRFRAEAGAQLAFEIETPGTLPPHFNPKLAVIDPQGRQIFSNLQRRVSLFNNNAEVEGYLKDIEPKAVHTFQFAGEYLLQVRDITARYGGNSFLYRILVRAQMPHVGEVSSQDFDRVNLSPGGSRKVALTAALEEGYSGDVVYSVSGLPPGVTMYPAGRLVEERAPRDLPENGDTVLPASYASTLIFAADAGAALIRAPALITLSLRPVVNGKPGKEVPVREFPLMLVERAEVKEKEK